MPGAARLRTSLCLVAAACAMGFVYVATKSVVLAAWHLHGTLWFWARFDRDSEPLIVSLACILGALGAGWESVVASRTRLRQRVALWQLRPLWKVLTRLAPTIHLPQGRGDSQFRLRRRVMEVRDGLLAIEERVSTGLVEAAQARAVDLGGTDALALAIVVRCLATEETADFSRPHSSGRARLPTGPATSFDEELEWLKEVSRWYRHPKASALSAQPVRALA